MTMTATMPATLLPVGEYLFGQGARAAEVAPSVVWPERATPDSELVRRIKEVEGETLESSPLSLKLTIALGSGILCLGGVVIVQQLASLLGLSL